MRTRLLWPLFAVIVSGCEGTLPVAASCPPPPPPPEVLLASPSIGPSLTELGKPYGTVRDWWKGLKGGPFFAEITPKGRQGWLVRFAPRWLDWRILQHNYPDRRDFSDQEPVSAEISADTPSRRDLSDEDANPAEKGEVLSQFDRRDFSGERLHKGTHDDQESSSSQPPRASDPPNRAMMMMMAGKGIKSAKALNAIASMGLDLATVEQSIDNLLADQTDIGAIVGLLKTAPPEPGKPYPRARAPAPRAPRGLPAAPERPSKPVLSAAERRQLLEQHRNGSS
jgi:hypothetical protein